jgi:CheY-like chemotaxis protein
MPTDPSKYRRHRERQHDGWRLVVLFLAYTGVRFGEMAALRVRRIDLLRRRAMIAESVTLVRSEQIWGTPKGHERRDVSPMSCEITRCPRQDSNLRHRLRRAVLYPLSYGGSRLLRVAARGCATVRLVTESEQSPGPRRRVLVVDDDPMIRHLITLNLELEGFAVAHADDGESCLEAVREFQPHVVVLDVAMPLLDGLVTAARLRVDPATSGIKIVMVSARAQQTDVRRGLDAGVDVYLTKPFDPDVLIRAVSELADARTADADGPAPR